DGVDGLFIGPSDLSIALGRFGDLMHDDVQNAIQRIYDAGKAANTAVGILAPVEAHARKYLEMGMTFVAVGADIGLFKNSTLELRKKFKPE
ncbi:MAG: 2-dehydro-3-deoxyglucarate aldolase, partial [Verrucomicrobiae bacterium]|nr:2-dehydro-3-deoxyglucarate aldolase [Verrucomicrobiae bacterium]